MSFALQEYQENDQQPQKSEVPSPESEKEVEQVKEEEVTESPVKTEEEPQPKKEEVVEPPPLIGMEETDLLVCTYMQVEKQLFF